MPHLPAQIATLFSRPPGQPGEEPTDILLSVVLARANLEDV